MPWVVNLTDRFKVLARDNFRCVYCGATPQTVELHVDHVFPKSKGGGDIINNYVTACFNCNVGKRDSILAEILGRTEFSNQEWRCDVDGLEHRGCGYFIEKERLNEIADYVGPWCSEWLEHICHKSFDLELFIEAFYQAFVISGTPIRFDWRRSVEEVRGKKKYSIRWEREFGRRLAEKYGTEPLAIRICDFDLMDDYQ